MITKYKVKWRIGVVGVGKANKGGIVIVAAPTPNDAIEVAQTQIYKDRRDECTMPQSWVATPHATT